MMSVSKTTLPSHKRNGFSLIELIVVIVIMALATAVVAPSLLKQYDSMKKNQELLQLDAYFNFSSQKAFYSKDSIRIEMADNQLVLYADGYEPSIKTFNTLEFEPQTVNYNRDGSPKPSQVKVTILGNEYDVELPQIIKTERHDSH